MLAYEQTPQPPKQLLKLSPDGKLHKTCIYVNIHTHVVFVYICKGKLQTPYANLISTTAAPEARLGHLSPTMRAPCSPGSPRFCLGGWRLLDQWPGFEIYCCSFAMYCFTARCFSCLLSLLLESASFWVDDTEEWSPELFTGSLQYGVRA